MPRIYEQPCRRCAGTGIEPNPIAIGSSMRALRIKAKLSIREVARRCSLSAAYISDLELGRRSWGPKASTKYREAIAK